MDRSPTPAYLNALLRVERPDVEVVAVATLDETEGSASRLRLVVDYAPGRNAGLPGRMFLKRNLAEFGFPVEMYTTEVRYYQDIHPVLTTEKPAVFAAHADGPADFSILMEDLGTRPGGRLGIVTEPVSLDQVAAVLDTLAGLHARYWVTPRLDWLDPIDDAVTAKFWQQIGPRLVHRHLERGHRVGSVDLDRWPEERMWAAFAQLTVENARGPTTALHGDVHAGNVYYSDAGCGLIDWQLMVSGCWALDAGYYLQTVLDPSTRADNEQNLLRHYLDQLGRLGVTPPTFGHAWERYRMQPIWGVMMWLITPSGVHSDEVQLTSLARCLAAADHLDTFALLDRG